MVPKDSLGGRRDPLYITGIPLHGWCISFQGELQRLTHSSLLSLCSLLPSWATLPNFAVLLTKTFLIQWKLQCISEYYSNFIFHCPEFLKNTVSYLRSTSTKQLGDKFDKCCSRLQLSRGFWVWNLAPDSPQFPLNCKTACQGKGGEPRNWGFKTELSKAVVNIPRKQPFTGRERCKELFSLTKTVLYIVLDFNSVYYSRHEGRRTKLGTSSYEQRYRMLPLVLGFKKFYNLNG